MAALVFVECEPRYGAQELLDEILDMPCDRASGKSRRSCTGPDLKWRVIVSPGSGRFSLPDVQVRALTQLPQLFGILDWDNVVWSLFVSWGVPGCIIEQWAYGPRVGASPVIRCGQCGKAYDLGADAGLLTPEGERRDIERYGGSLTYTGQEPVILRDSVFVTSNVPAFREGLADVINGLAAGKLRRWRCAGCGYQQGYPGSLYRDAS